MQTTLAYAPTPEDLADEHFFEAPVIYSGQAATDDEEAEQGEP